MERSSLVKKCKVILRLRKSWSNVKCEVQSQIKYRFCLRGPNLCKLCELLWGSQIWILPLATLAFSSQFVLVIYLYVQILQRVEVSASLSDPKGQRIMMIVCITCTSTLQHFSNVANSPKHPCRRDILWSQSP